MTDEHDDHRKTRRAVVGAGGIGLLAAAGLVARAGGEPDDPADAPDTPVAAGRAFRPTNAFVFGHSWAAGVNVGRGRAWPSLVADRLHVARPRLFPSLAARRTNFAWGGARATGSTSEHGAGWVLRSLPRGPSTRPSLILLLTGDLDIDYHGQSAASRALLGGGIHAALGRLQATAVHEEDDRSAWAFDGSWSTDRGREVNSGSRVAYSLRDGARFSVVLPPRYDGTPVTVGLPLFDRTVGGTVAWDVDGRPLGRTTDLEALRGVLTDRHPRAVYAERFADLPPGAKTLRGTWTAGPRAGAAIVVDYWSLGAETAPVVCPLMPRDNPWDNDFGGITVASNTANREALRTRPRVTYVDLQRAVCPTGTAADRRFWDSDASSHLTLRGERAVADAVVAAVRRIGVGG